MSLQAEAEAMLAQVDAQTDSASLTRTSKYARLSIADIKAILSLTSEGYTQVEIAKIVGCAQATVSNTLRDCKSDPETVRLLLASQAEEAAENWIRASREAAKRGDHRPSRELIEAAHPSLKPAATPQQGGGITINIGTSSSPVRLPVIDLSLGESVQLQTKPTQLLNE